MDVLLLQKVERRRVERFGTDGEFALPHALAPLRVPVAQTLHLEAQDRFERDRADVADERDEIDFGR